MVINPGITLDPSKSQVHDLRHIRPAADTGARLLTYQLSAFVGSTVSWVLVVVMLAVAVVLVYGALRPRRSGTWRSASACSGRTPVRAVAGTTTTRYVSARCSRPKPRHDSRCRVESKSRRAGCAAKEA